MAHPKRLARGNGYIPVVTACPLYTLQPHDQLTLVGVAPKIFEFYTHWNGRRTVPCWKEKEGDECDGCDVKKHPRRWKGLLDVWQPATRSHWFLALTPDSAKALLDQCGRRNLRGVVFTAMRARSQKRGTILVTVIDMPFSDIEGLPKPADPLKTLSNVWGIQL